MPKPRKNWRDMKIPLGTIYGFLKVISEVFQGPSPSNKSSVRCMCMCGRICAVPLDMMIPGIIKSCGCMNYWWGHRHTNKNSATYRTWNDMKSRCLNPNVKAYENYGGRGIRVCDRWMNFNHFLADMGIRPKGRTIGRINNYKNYEPENCRWETVFEQNRNRRSNVRITFMGKTMCIREWEEFLGQKWISRRLKDGWSVERALNYGVPKTDTRFTG